MEDDTDRYAETPRLKAWAEVLDMALAHMTGDQAAQFAANLADRSNVINTDPAVRLVYEQDFFEAFAGEYEFLDLYIAHALYLASKDDWGPPQRCCIKCREPIEDIPLCFSCNSDRWIVITRL